MHWCKAHSRQNSLQLFHLGWFHIMFSMTCPWKLIFGIYILGLNVHLCKNSFEFSYPFWSEKAMAPHSSTLAWKIPWMEEPGGLPSMGSLRVGHDWVTSLSLFTCMHWRRKWQPTPVFFPGESQGWGRLVGCRLWGHTESDTTEATWQQQHPFWLQVTDNWLRLWILESGKPEFY